MTITKQRCRACGSYLETIEYQARSADEATRSTTTCPNCPIDASKINTSYRPSNYPRGLTGPVRVGKRPLTKQDVVTSHKVWQIRIEYTTNTLTTDAELKHVTCPIQTNRSMSIGGTSDDTTRIRYQMTGINQGLCESLVDRTRIGFGTLLDVVQLYRVSNFTVSTTSICEGKYGIIEKSSDTVTYLYNDSVANKDIIVVQSIKLLDVPSAAKIVARLYSTTCVPKSLQWYLQKRDLSTYANLAPRAWDVSAPPPQGYCFTSKPDGERMWLVAYGAFWYGCECKGARNIIKWWYDPNTVRVVEKPIICDTEYVSGYGFIFIDCLTDVHGVTVPAARDITHSLSIVNTIMDTYSASPLIVREYFENNVDAQLYSDRQVYPTDGTLGIRDGSTETVKIKAVKGADLLLCPGGALVTSDGDTVASISGYSSQHVGKVVEIRFTAQQNRDQGLNQDNVHMNVIDVFPRTNKVTPNSTEAVMNILRSCVQIHATTDRERTMALKWCNALCNNIVERAILCDDTKHIVLDVGTGSGQSLDRLKPSESVSFVYLEPDKSRAQNIAKRSKSKLVLNPIEVASMVTALKTRKVRQVVLNCTLENLLANAEVCNRLMPELKCVIATFSAQFVVNELRFLRETHNVKVFGCMYTYDNASGNVLVDDCGASMRITDDNEATIRWGTEKQYTEPVTYQVDYYGTGTVVLASDILQLPSGPDSDGPARVCRHIRVII